MFIQKAVRQILAVITANGMRERPFYSIDLVLCYIRPTINDTTQKNTALRKAKDDRN